MQLKISGIIFINLFAIRLFASEINCSEGFSFVTDKKSCIKFLTTDEERKKGLKMSKEHMVIQVKQLMNLETKDFQENRILRVWV